MELGKRLLGETDPDRLLKLAMDNAIEISGAERGLIILFDAKGETYFQTARHLSQTDLQDPKFEISRTVIDRVRQGRAPIYLNDALRDPSLKNSQSANRLRILSVICLPVANEQRGIRRCLPGQQECAWRIHR